MYWYSEIVNFPPLLTTGCSSVWHLPLCCQMLWWMLNLQKQNDNWTDKLLCTLPLEFVMHCCIDVDIKIKLLQ